MCKHKDQKSKQGSKASMAATSVLSRTFSSVSLSHIPNSPSLPFISTNLFHHKTSSRTASLTIRKHGALKVHSMTASFDSRLEDTVKKTVADNPVVVYSKTWCPYSSEVKSLFNQIGVQPLVVELDEIGEDFFFI
ncbi:putative glutaredoxin, Thioredoxin-like superfamily [Helianthus annuus]|nr:putative glutaredoxin, Thioredoxin-like superfamily [Helianthus annuus]